MNSNIGDNFGYINQNVQYINCAISQEGIKATINPKDYYDEDPALGIIGRLVIAILSFAADLVAAFSEINPFYQENPVGTVYNMFAIFFNGTVSEAVNVGIFVILTVVLGMFSYFLFTSMIKLLVDSRCGNLRRIGIKVVKIKPKKCPYCKQKLKLIYQNGNYLACTESPAEHRIHLELSKGRD